MPEFDSTAYLDGFALIVSSPAVQVAVQPEPWPSQGRPRARRFAAHVPLEYRFADDQKWHAGVTDNISHSGLLFRVERDQSERDSLTGAGPGTPVAVRLTVPTDAAEATAQIESEGRLVRVDGSADKTVAVSVRGYRLS